MSDFHQDFLSFCIEKKILTFGAFKTKFGRESPYFFNAGLFYHGDALNQLADFYAQTIIENNIQFDVLFGPAYKGIILAAITSMALAKRGIHKPFAYNRKEVKDHGEGGILVGAPLKGDILIIDDVISAGTSVRDSYKIIENEKAISCGVIVALDRMEKGTSEFSAVEEVKKQLNIPVTAIASLEDLLTLIKSNPLLKQYEEAISHYRSKYGTY